MSHRPLVGVIANPASGKDIRRLVAVGSSIDNTEKIAIVRRVFAGLAAVGIGAVAYMPDTFGIVSRAVAAAPTPFPAEPLPMVCLGVPGDTEEAARRLADMGAAAIVTLGGDGTNRMVARGCGDVPLVPISTGTNNVFPRFVEGTLAGMAAGAVASGVVHNTPETPLVVRQQPRLVVSVNGEPRDMALIDAVTTRQGWIGARAVWKPEHLREVVLSCILPAEIGMASLGGLLFPGACGGPAGAAIVVDQSSGRRIHAPLAPGLLPEVGIASARLLGPGETIALQPGPCTIALDGEREIEILDSGRSISVALDPQGPRVVEIAEAIRQAAAAGAFAVPDKIPG